MLVKKVRGRGTAIDLWRYYDENEPLNVSMIGFVDGAEPGSKLRVERQDLSMTALMYVREGRGHLEVNGRTYTPEAGSLIILPKGYRHVYYPDKRSVWKRDWLVADGPLMDALVKSYIPGEEYCIDGCDLAGLFDALREAAGKEPFDYHEFVDFAAVKLCEAFASVKEVVRKRSNRVALATRDLLDANVEGTITIEDISARLNISPNYVIRQFKESYGCTPYKYYTDRKIKLAKLFLRTTDMSMAEISDRLHFADQHYFSNAFRQHSGMSASEYRRKYSAVINRFDD